jgi:hypothetical protein
MTPTNATLSITAAALGLACCTPARPAVDPTGAKSTPTTTATKPAATATKPAATATKPAATATKPAATALARPPSSWVAARVAKAKARLAQSPGGRLIWQSIERHGGLTRWFENGPLQFRFRYAPKKPGSKVRDSTQLVDTWRARARHTLTAAAKVRFGWDGQTAWVAPRSAKKPLNVRFWSLTPFYFVGIPFVLADPGTRFTLLPETRLGGRRHQLVKVGYGSSVGDSPGDYYIVYIDAETQRVGGVRYIVSYPGFFPKGGHSPEKLLVYEGSRAISGITLPQRFYTLTWDPKTKRTGKRVVEVTFSDVRFVPDVPAASFAIPADARRLSGWN